MTRWTTCGPGAGWLLDRMRVVSEERPELVFFEWHADDEVEES